MGPAPVVGLSRPLLPSVTVAAERLVVSGVSTAAVLETGCLDLLALDEGRRATVAGAFARLCHGLDHRLQIVVQSRRWSRQAPSAAPAGDERLQAVGRRLDAAAREHLDASLATRPAFRRSILLVCAVDGTDTGSMEHCERAAAQVAAQCAAAGIPAWRLGDVALAARLAEAWGGDLPRGTRPPLLVPPPWHAGPRRVVCGRVHLRAVVLRRLPGVAVDCGWLSPLLGIAAEWDVALHLAPVPLQAAMSRLGRRLRDLRADQLVEIDRDQVGDATLAAGADAALELRERLARRLARPLTLSLVAVARADDAAEVERVATALRLGLAASLAEAHAADLEHLDAAISAWPLGLDGLVGAGKLVDSAAATTCTPWVEARCDDPQGYRLGRSLEHHTPVCLDPFATSEHANANVAVLAASGQGKSYLLGGLVLEAAARGVGSIVVDPEGEYRRLVGALGGDYVWLAPGSTTAINVFDVGDATGDPGTRSAEAVAAVVDLVNVLCGSSLDDVERARVDAAATAALRRATGDGHAAVLADCLAELEETAPRVSVVLRRFCSGPLGQLFSRPTTARLDAAVVGIGLRDLKDEFVPAATLVVAEWLWSVIRRDPRRRHLVFDEVGLLCAHAPLRRLLVQLARRCRKYGTSLVVATQNATDLLATEEGTVVATNPSVVFLGGHRGAETRRMQEAFSLTAAQRRRLEEAGRGEFLLIAGSRRLGLRVEFSPLHHDLLTAPR